MKHPRHADGERTLAIFFDFENIGIGLNQRRDRFDITRVLERLVEKGKIVVKKAYADWSRFAQYTAALHEAAIELIEIPRRAATGKNSADIRLCVDAMDLAYSKEHIDTFVIVSGDSDFSPLVSKLKELGKHLIGLGLPEATSDLLRDNCDEFIYYDDLDRAPAPMSNLESSIPEPKRKVFQLLTDSLLALRRENKEVLFSSMVKDTMKRKKPSFNEEYHGYRTFSELLEDAAKAGVCDIEKHKTSGTYVVTRFGSEPKVNPPADSGRAKANPAPVEAAKPKLAPVPTEVVKPKLTTPQEAAKPKPAPIPAETAKPKPTPAPQAPAKPKPAPTPPAQAAPNPNHRRPPQEKPQPPKQPAPPPAPVPEEKEDILDAIEDRYGEDW